MLQKELGSRVSGCGHRIMAITSAFQADDAGSIPAARSRRADMAQLVERTLGKGEVPSSTLGISTSFSVKVRHLEKNLSGGCSAVVPPDPMPNSEVKRRSADGSVGSPHARVGNCQTSNKSERPSERMAFLRLYAEISRNCIRHMALMNNLR